jgi:FKBP-type peptidyl-prolyl cis-trans isomerase SlyD
LLIANNVVALIEYTLRDDSGEVIDSSVGQDPLAYIHGQGNLIPGLESELEGKQKGDVLKVTVPPKLGYGERDPSLQHQVQRQQLPPNVQIELGTQFQARGPQGSHIMTVVAVEGDRVFLDANHPLAGVTLHFEVKVIDTREATAEELQHGHVHGPGGHHH